MNASERAYDLLKWQTVLEPAPYEELTDYHAIWKQRSDQALDDWDKQNPYVVSDELGAFHELERLRIYTQQDYFSPTKAKDGFYTRRLERARKQIDAGQRGRSQQKPWNAQGPFTVRRQAH